MGLFSKLFGRGKRNRVSPALPPASDHNPKKEEGIPSKPIELTEEDHALLASLRIDEATGLQLKTQTQNKIEGLFIRFLEDDREPELRGVSSLYQGKDAAISRLNEQRSASDIHFFECGGYASDKNSYIAVVRTADRYDILEIMETNGINYDVSTEDIVAYLKRWEAKVPFLITQCEADTLVIMLDGNNPHLPEMVKEAVVICPDLIAGDNTPEAFDEVLTFVGKSGEIYFWWD